MQKAIIYTANRCIRRLTTDDNPPLASDESSVDMPTPIDMGGGYWKLDVSNNKVAATLTEAREAGLDEEYTAQQRLLKRQEFLTALETARDNTTLVTIKTMLTKWREIYR